MSNNSSEFFVADNDKKLKNAIQEQSDQLLTMVDIINMYDTQTKLLNDKVKLLEQENQYTKSIFNNQLLLFLLVLVILYLIYYRSCKV
jgi:PIN domain nuclease of toxin-antitoxin system